jgi:RNA polymerase sigma-70 factor (ECF subfamily)
MSFDNNQFVELVEVHSRMVFKISGAYTKTSHDREDLISEILLQLWRTSCNFKGNCKVSTWVYRVALNTAMNFRRKKKAETLFTPTDFGKPSQFGQIIEAEPSEELDILYRCIDELDDLNKAIILLYLDGNPHDEIAEITGISKSNVGTRIGRIKEQLKKSVTTKI